MGHRQGAELVFSSFSETLGKHLLNLQLLKACSSRNSNPIRGALPPARGSPEGGTAISPRQVDSRFKASPPPWLSLEAVAFDSVSHHPALCPCNLNTS